MRKTAQSEAGPRRLFIIRRLNPICFREASPPRPRVPPLHNRRRHWRSSAKRILWTSAITLPIHLWQPRLSPKATPHSTIAPTSDSLYKYYCLIIGDRFIDPKEWTNVPLLMPHASVWFPYPLIICNIFILFIAISIKITIFANKILWYGKIH